MARTREAMVVMVVLAAMGTFGATRAAAQVDVIIITPPGYVVTQGEQLASPPPTQLASPVLAVPVYTAPATEIDSPRTRANRGLILGGAISLGVGYVGNVFGTIFDSIVRGLSGVDNTDEFFAYGFVPIAGPWMQLAFAANDTERGYLIGAGLLQAAGLTMIIAGLTFARRPVTEVRLSDSSSVTFAPTVSGDGAGLTAIGKF